MVSAEKKAIVKSEKKPLENEKKEQVKPSKPPSEFLSRVKEVWPEVMNDI